MSTENVSTPLPDFELVANMLVEEGVNGLSPSELHGLFSGHLAAGARLKEEALLKSASELMDVNSITQENSKVVLLDMYHASCGQLEGMDLDFELVLPDDDHEITHRAEALGFWCQGFLCGFGLYGKHTDASLSDESKETLNDLGQIAQISSEVDDAESNEADLMEVQEYLRMAVLMLFAECNKALADKEKEFARIQPESGRLH